MSNQDPSRPSRAGHLERARKSPCPYDVIPPWHRRRTPVFRVLALPIGGCDPDTGRRACPRSTRIFRAEIQCFLS